MKDAHRKWCMALLAGCFSLLMPVVAQESDSVFSMSHLALRFDSQKQRLVMATGEANQIWVWDLKTQQQRFLTVEFELIQAELNICFRPGSDELIGLAYGIGELTTGYNENLPLNEQSDTLRRVFRVNLVTGQLSPFANGRYDGVLSGYRNTTSDSFSKDCRLLNLLGPAGNYEQWDVGRLKRIAEPFPDQPHDQTVAYEAVIQSLVEWGLLPARFQFVSELPFETERSIYGVQAVKPTQSWQFWAHPRVVKSQPRFYPLSLRLTELNVTAISPDERWALLVGKDWSKLGVYAEQHLLALDLKTGQLKTLLKQILPEELEQMGFVQYQGQTVVWLARQAQLERWSLPTAQRWPTLHSGLTKYISHVWPDPVARRWLVVDLACVGKALPDGMWR